MTTTELPQQTTSPQTTESGFPIKVLDGLIIRDPKLRGGRPVLAGTGIAGRTIAGHYKLGLNAEQIADRMDLELALVYAALTYYHLHQAEIDADILADSEEVLMQKYGNWTRENRHQTVSR
jgi:uncharacterized protein (DUF433 family)